MPHFAQNSQPPGCFNEAETKRPRKSPGTRDAWPAWSSFNEAETKRPRKFVSGVDPAPPLTGFNEAETKRPRKCAQPYTVFQCYFASMRPRPRGLGNLAQNFSGRQLQPLQ